MVSFSFVTVIVNIAIIKVRVIVKVIVGIVIIFVIVIVVNDGIVEEALPFVGAALLAFKLP